MLEKYPIHLIIRYSDNLYKIDDVVSEHTKIIDKNGMVWFGKVGKPLGLPHLETINNQCTSGVPTYLYLIQKVGKNYLTHRGKLIKASRSFPTAQKSLIPKYYYEKEILSLISIWFNLSEITKMDEGYLSNLRVVTSIMTITETLASSMAAMFIVKEVKKRENF